MAKKAQDSAIKRIRLVGRAEGLVARFDGFDRKRHTVPDSVTAATQGFLARLCEEDLNSEAEAFFQRVRADMEYKRKDISLTIDSPAAVLEAKDFVFEWEYALNEPDPATYTLARSMRNLRSSDLVMVERFDALFDGLFSSVVLDLGKQVRVEAVIDAVEGLEGEDVSMSVDYPSDCSECTLRVPGINAEVICDGASLEMRFSKNMGPRALLLAFDEMRRAFDLSRQTALSALIV